MTIASQLCEARLYNMASQVITTPPVVTPWRRSTGRERKTNEAHDR